MNNNVINILFFLGNTTIAVSNDRVNISTIVAEENLVKSYFKIEHASMSDRGTYTCIAQNVADHNPNDKEFSQADCYVRIKGRLVVNSF